VNATTNHINTHESRTVRGARSVFLFSCGYTALGLTPRMGPAAGVQRSGSSRLSFVFSRLSPVGIIEGGPSNQSMQRPRSGR